VFARKIAIKIHLSDVGVNQRGNFQVNDDEAAQPPMEEHQVHPKPLMADPQPFLSADKRKFVAEFQQESFKVSDERVFQIAFGVFVFEAEKFEDERIADFFVGGNRIPALGFSPFSSIATLFFDNAVRS
jgi:hypothetical protein